MINKSNLTGLVTSWQESPEVLVRVLTFGGADELEAYLRSKVNDTKYDDEIITVRKKPGGL